MLRSVSTFLYGGRQPGRAPAPRQGSEVFQLRFDNDYTIGLLGGPRRDRFLSYGVNLDRFRRGVWYRLPRRASTGLRVATVALEPRTLTRAAVNRSR